MESAEYGRLGLSQGQPSQESDLPSLEGPLTLLMRKQKVVDMRLPA